MRRQTAARVEGGRPRPGWFVRQAWRVVRKHRLVGVVSDRWLGGV